jgi:GTP cyclohydrolase I
MAHEQPMVPMVSIAGSATAPPARRVLPDVAQDSAAHVGGRLNRVGMAGIELALRVRTADGELVLTPARATAQISLDDPDAKGIHMSRLFLALQKYVAAHELSCGLVDRLLQEFVASHADLSRSSYVEFRFEYLAKRSSLLSDHTTWRSYPVRIEGELLEGRMQHRLQVSVAYSSTCPCSAALARQLLQQQFMEDCGDFRWLSVSHVTRWLGSQAEVTVVLAPDYPTIRSPT